MVLPTISPNAPPSAHYSSSIGSTETPFVSPTPSFTANWPDETGSVRGRGLADITLHDADKGSVIKNDLKLATDILSSAIDKLRSKDYDRNPLRQILGQFEDDDLETSRGGLSIDLSAIKQSLEALKQDTNRIVWTSGSNVTVSGATLRADPQKRILLTDNYFAESSIDRAMTLVHEVVHVLNGSLDYLPGDRRGVAETQGPNREPKEVVAASIRRLQASVDAAAMQRLGLSEDNVRTNVSAHAGRGRSIRALQRDLGIAASAGDSYRHKYQQSADLRRHLGLNNPNTVVALVLAYGNEEVMRGYPRTPSPPHPSIETLHSGYRDENLLNPNFGRIYRGDVEGNNVRAEVNYNRARRVLLAEHSTHAALDVVEQLRIADTDIRRRAAQDGELLEALAWVANNTNTTRGPAAGSEACAPLRYVANLARIVLDNPRADVDGIIHSWFGNSTNHRSPASMLLYQHALPALSDLARTIYADLLRDLLWHPQMEDRGRRLVADLLERSYAQGLYQLPLLGTKEAHTNLLQWINEAGVHIQKQRFRSMYRVTIQAPSRVTRPPEDPRVIDLTTLRERATATQSYLKGHLERLERILTGSSSTSSAWARMRVKEDQKFKADANKLMAISEASFRMNEGLAVQRQHQKAAFAQAERTNAANRSVMEIAQRNAQSAIWSARQASSSRAIMAKADSDHRVRQNAILDGTGQINRMITSGSGAASNSDRTALPSSGEFSAIQASRRAISQHLLEGSHQPTGSSGLSRGNESSSLVPLERSTFIPSYRIQDQNMIIDAQTQQGQHVSIEVPPSQGPGVIFNYEQEARTTSIGSAASTSAISHTATLPTLNYASHHERSGWPVVQLENSSGGRFTAASHQGFTVNRGQSSTTYSRRDL